MAQLHQLALQMLDPAQNKFVILMAQRRQMVTLGTHLLQFEINLRRRQGVSVQTVFTQQPQPSRGVLSPVFFKDPQGIVQPGQHLRAV
ncbi:hypothetical protein D3C72_420100 [compost metagenome]